MFTDDPNDPSRWIIGLDQQCPMTLEFSINSLGDCTDDTDTIACPMIDKIISSDLEDELPVASNLHQYFDNLYQHLEQSS